MHGHQLVLAGGAIKAASRQELRTRPYQAGHLLVSAACSFFGGGGRGAGGGGGGEAASSGASNERGVNSAGFESVRNVECCSRHNAFATSHGICVSTTLYDLSRPDKCRNIVRYDYNDITISLHFYMTTFLQSTLLLRYYVT